MSFDSTLHAKAIDLTKLAYQMTAAAGSGHPSSAASLAHLVAVLMYQHMRYEPANPKHPASDRLASAKGTPCRSSMPRVPTRVSTSASRVRCAR